MQAELLAQTAPREPSANARPDGAHDTRDCSDAVVKRWAQADHPPRKHANLWAQTSPGSINRNSAVTAYKRLG